MRIFSLLNQAQEQNGQNNAESYKEVRQKHEELGEYFESKHFEKVIGKPRNEEHIESIHSEKAMDKHDHEEGILNEGQNPEPFIDDSVPEQIREVDPSFEETRMSGEEHAYQSENEQEEVKQSRELQITDERVFQSQDFSKNIMDKGSPHNSGPRWKFAPDLADTSSPEHRQFASQLSPGHEINVFVDDNIVVKENQVQNSPRDQKPDNQNLRLDTEPQVENQNPEQIQHVRQEMNNTQVSVATFTGMGSERKSLDKETLRSSKAESLTRTRIKSHFRKSNSKGQQIQLINNADSQDIDENAISPRLNAFDLTEQSGIVPKYQQSVEQQEDNENEPEENKEFQEDDQNIPQAIEELNATNTQWHDVQIVPTEDGNQELVIENLENLQNATALVVTRHGNQFKIGIQEEAAGASENLSQKGGNPSQQSLQQKLKLRGKFGKKRTSETLTENLQTSNMNDLGVKSRGSSKKSRQGNEHPLKLINQTSSASIKWENKYKTFQDPLPENNKKEEISPKLSQKSKLSDMKPKNAATQYSPSLNQQKFIPAVGPELIEDNNEIQMTENNDEIKSQSQNSLNFVKVVDPYQKNDKRDQNDIVEKKRNGSRNIEAASTANEEIRGISGRAQRSVNSRQVTGPSIPPTQDLKNMLKSPESRKSRISVRLQDKLGSSSVNSSMNMSDAQGQVKLNVKKRNNISMERSDLKSPTQRAERPKKPVELQEIQSVSSKQTKEKKALQSVEDDDIESRFQLQDQPSRISVISRRSNADQKGQHLAKQPTVKESEHEESPDKQSENQNVLARDPSEEQIQILPEKEMISTPQSVSQIVANKALAAEIATQTQSSLDKLEKQQTLIESKFNQSVRSSKKILYNSSKRSLLNRSTDTMNQQESEKPNTTKILNNEDEILTQPKLLEADPSFDIVKNCKSIFPGLVEKVKADKKLQKSLIKQLNEIKGNVGDLPEIFQQEKPDMDEFESALTDISSNTLEKVYKVLSDVSKSPIKETNRSSSIQSSSNKKNPEISDISRSELKSRKSNKSKSKVSESEKVQASENRRASQSEQKGVNIRKIRSPASIKTLEPASSNKHKETKLDNSREKNKELNKTAENFASVRSSSKKMNNVDQKVWKQVEKWFAQLDMDNNGFLDIVEIKPYIEQYLKKEFEVEASKGLIQDTFADISVDGVNVTKQGLYDHIMTVSDVMKTEVEKEQLQKKKQPSKKLSEKLEQHQQHKPLSVQSRNSGNSHIQREEASQNYHTQTEDIGDAIFPQIMRYTETGPQESILSRDHYSTSNHASIVSRKDRNRAQMQRAETNSITTQPQPGNYLKKLQDGNNEAHKSDTENKKLKPIPKPKKELRQYQHKEGNQSQAKGIARQITRVEQSHPDEQSGISVDNENFQTSDGLTPVLEEERNFSQGEKINIEPSNIQNAPLVANEQHLPKLGGKKGKLKSTFVNKVPALPLQTTNHPESETNIPEKRLESENQDTELSHVTPKKNKLPALAQSIQSNQSIGKQSKKSKQSQSNDPLRSSRKMKGQKKRENSNPVTELRNSKNNPLNDDLKDNQQPLRPQGSVDGGSVKNLTQPIPSEMRIKERQASEAIAGKKSQRTSILPAVVQSKPPQANESIRSSLHNSPYSNNQSSKPTQRNRTIEASSGHQLQDGKPIMKYMEASDTEQKSYPLKYFKGQDLELYYMEKQLKPGVEREIKEGFFEIRKKFGGQQPIEGEEVQVYVSHLCLHNYHPIFCKFNLDVVKTILNFSQIIYLKKGQTLYEQGFNDKYLYVILFGKLQLLDPESDAQIGQALNIGWTVGEEILFKSDKKANGGVRLQKCKSMCDSCVLGIEKRSLAQIKRTLVERRQAEEFVKLEVVLRGNYLVKKTWRQ